MHPAPHDFIAFGKAGFGDMTAPSGNLLGSRSRSGLTVPTSRTAGV